MALHVAAMPFPSPQGTQAAVRAMLEALAAAGDDVHLATYAHGGLAPPSQPIEIDGDLGATARLAHGGTFAVHRVPDFPRDRSLCSGPSARKLALDASLALLVAQLVRRLRPSLVVAHHAEAMLAALAARARPLVYVAHTALGPELPSYLSLPFVTRAGDLLDRLLVRRADVACAVAPSLAAHLEQVAERAVHALPLPWPPWPPDTASPTDARLSLGIAADERVLLYAGNLDAYQGIAMLLDAARLVSTRVPRTRLLVATESDASHLRRDAAGLALTIAPLAVEADRACAHAAADVAIVPRALPGGVPVKLLDALSRGVPVVAARRAMAGLTLGDAVIVVSGDDPETLAVGVRTLLATPASRASVVAAGKGYLGREHTAAHFVEQFDRAARQV